MSADHRLFSLLDDHDVFPYDPSLRIPPLQNPLPLSSSSRPSPLEPNARINEASHGTATKLISRREALAEAKSIGETDGTENAHQSQKRHKIVDNGRMTDFVKLPKPRSKTKIEKPPPFNPVPILNELHEPPPSAARFPPITPGASQGREEDITYDYHRNSSTIQDRCKEQANPVNRVSQDNERIEKTKRVCLRLRRRWTEEETKDLIKGVELYGVGKWKKIINDPEFSFHRERTPVDLKDRYRTWKMSEEKTLSRLGARQVLGSGNVRPRQVSVPHIKSLLSNSRITEKETSMPNSGPAHLQPKHQPDDQASQPKPAQGQMGSANSVSNTFTPVNDEEERNQPVKDSQREQSTELAVSEPFRARRNRPPRWTKEEDASLIKGYQKHGFAWTMIAKDRELNLSGRTGAQVRDRFRLTQPHAYASSVPIQLADMARISPQTSPGPRAKKRTTNSNQISMIAPATTLLERSDPPSPYNPFASASEGAQKLDMGSDLPFRPEKEVAPELYKSKDERSRQSSVAGDEARNLGILSLLNDDNHAKDGAEERQEEAEEEAGRLPPSRYLYDEWGSDSLTLPPVNWEDLAPRPLFDID